MSTGAADFMSYRFSKREFPERMRIPLWREKFGRCIVHADIEPLSDTPFCADATLQAIQGLRTIALKGSSMRFKRSLTSIADGDDSIGLIVCRRPLQHTAVRQFPLCPVCDRGPVAAQYVAKGLGCAKTQRLAVGG